MQNSIFQIFQKDVNMKNSGLWIMCILHPNALLLSESLMIWVPSDERLDNLTTMSYVSSHHHSVGS